MSATRAILVVDNEPEVGRFIAAILKRAGYTAVVTESGREAIQAYRQSNNPILLALIDVVMPDMDGPSVGRALRAIDPEVRMLFMSAYQREHLERYGEELRQAEILKKPFTPSELVLAVERFGSSEPIAFPATSVR